jgi:hypothetical protein
MLFRRSVLTAGLPEPGDRALVDELPTEFEPLWRHAHVAEAYRPVLLAVLVAALMPTIPHPVLALLGEHGSGKSSAMRAFAALIDASPARTRKPPSNLEAWVTAAHGSWCVPLDNLTTMPEWLSDGICRAVTGDADVRRRLYSDSDLTVFAFRRVVMLTGIDLGTFPDDLADRLVAVQLEAFSDDDQLTEETEMAEDWDLVYPRLLTALLDLTAAVLEALPTVRLGHRPRMADFARVLAAVDKVLGTDGLETYRGLGVDLAADAATGHPVLVAISSNVQESFIGTSAQLLKKITPEDDQGWRPPRGWPRTARELTTILRRALPTLRKLGWIAEDRGRRGRAKAVQFQLVPPEEP